MDTEENVRLAKRGDEGAAEAVLTEFSRMVTALAHNYADYGDEQDMVQVGLIAVANAIKDYDDRKGAKFFTYAYMCAERRMIDEARKNSRRIKTVAFENVPEPQYDGGMAERLIAEELLQKISGALSEFELKALMLTTQDLSYAEAALRLETTAKAVDNAVSRARKKIRALA